MIITKYNSIIIVNITYKIEKMLCVDNINKDIIFQTF